MQYTTKTKIRTWGNGYGVLLPKKVVEDSIFRGVGEVELRFTSDGATLTPAKKKYTLQDMVSGMRLTSNKKRHALVAFGDDIGREIWQ